VPDLPSLTDPPLRGDLLGQWRAAVAIVRNSRSLADVMKKLRVVTPKGKKPISGVLVFPDDIVRWAALIAAIYLEIRVPRKLRFKLEYAEDESPFDPRVIMRKLFDIFGDEIGEVLTPKILTLLKVPMAVIIAGLATAEEMQRAIADVVDIISPFLDFVKEKDFREIERSVFAVVLPLTLASAMLLRPQTSGPRAGRLTYSRPKKVKAR
jgi:hypothetical protein